MINEWGAYAGVLPQTADQDEQDESSGPAGAYFSISWFFILSGVAPNWDLVIFCPNQAHLSVYMVKYYIISSISDIITIG